MARVIPFPPRAVPLSAEAAWEDLRRAVIAKLACTDARHRARLEAEVSRAEAALARSFNGR